MSTANLDSHAIATLHYIRSSMESAASVAVPGSAGIVMGAIGIGAAGLAMTPGFANHWLAVWLGAAFVAACSGTVLLLRPVSARGVSLRGTPMQKFALCLCPALIAGALMTAVLVNSGQLQLIAGTWLLLYGAALASASVPTTRMLLLMGALFGLIGLVTFFVAHPVQMLALGLGFGGLHLCFGMWMVSYGSKE
jgi:hypothetical protein